MSDWAEWYDVIYDYKYQSMNDYEFYKPIVESYQPALEIGCGTGRIYNELSADGYDVYGLDHSLPMLDKLQNKAEGRGLSPNVFQEDITRYTPNNYEFIFFPFSGILHITNPYDKFSAIKNAYQGLSDDGIFAMDLAIPRYSIQRDEFNAKTVSYDNIIYQVEARFWIENEIDMIRKVQQRVIHNDNIVFEQTLDVSDIPKQQIKFYLDEIGFSKIEFYEAFGYDTVTEDTDHIIVVAQK